MERSEPSLVPQWYKLANGSTNIVSGRADENGLRLSSRNSLVSDRDRKTSSLKRNLSSSGTIAGNSQAYGSFHSFCERSQEKSFCFRNTENRYVLIDSGFHDYNDLSLGGKTEKDALRCSLSLIKEREGDKWPKKIGTVASSDTLSWGGLHGGVGKALSEKDFPSLGAEGRQGLSNVGGLSSPGPRTALQSLPTGPPVIVGTSALAELPGQIEANGLGHPFAVQAAPLGHAFTTLSTTNGLNMAEALVQAPSQAHPTEQLSVDTQKIEELALKKCKQLIPVTPSMAKALTRTEKSKPKGRGVHSSALNKAGQESSLLLVNHAVGLSARTETSEPSRAGNLQVLSREKNVNSPTAKDGRHVGEIVSHMNLVPLATQIPLKSPVDKRVKAHNNSSATQSSFVERKSFSLAQKRNEFFNLLRKKSSESSNAISEAPFNGSAISENNSLSTVSASGYSMENGNTDLTQEHEFPDNEETNSCTDPIDDPEEEAFLQSLGWDKNVTEEALTKEEIDGFLKKYQTQKASLKLASPQLNEYNGASQLGFSAWSS